MVVKNCSRQIPRADIGVPFCVALRTVWALTAPVANSNERIGWILGRSYNYSMKPEITPQIDEAASRAKTRRLRYVQLFLISPSVVIVSLVVFDLFLDSGFFSLARMFGFSHFYFFVVERVYGWAGRAVFYTSPILFLYNIFVYLKLARRLNHDNSWIETIMMVIVILASFLLFFAVVFLILTIRNGGIMPFPAV
jgi:hypothetical protein